MFPGSEIRNVKALRNEVLTNVSLVEEKVLLTKSEKRKNSNMNALKINELV